MNQHEAQEITKALTAIISDIRVNKQDFSNIICAAHDLKLQHQTYLTILENIRILLESPIECPKCGSSLKMENIL